MKIIFVRHGIAEDRDLGKSDELRELTEEGIHELEFNAGFLQLYLRNEETRIISSPLLRAGQTARILSEAGVGDVETMDFVSDGEFDKLRQLVLSQPETVFVIVGHAPYLDDWIFAVTNQTIEMKKASAAQIEITDPDTFTGYLTWYLPIGKYNRLIQFGSFEEILKNLESDVEAIIEKYHGIILENREAYLREPEEIESVHKLRVKIRQFRSLVSFFKPLMSKRKHREIQEVLREMAQECAYLRELDVLMKEWTDRKNEFKKAGLTGENFFRIMQEERGIEQERLFAFLEKPDFARELNKVVEQLEKAIDLNETQYLELDEMVEDTLDTWHDEIKAEYDAIDVNDLAIIHALRIRAKKMRYIMEVFELDTAADSKAMYKEIKRWQEVLGNITDANRNSEAVMEIAEKYPDAPIEEELELFKTIEAKEANQLYQEFFGSGDHEKAAEEHPEELEDLESPTAKNTETNAASHLDSELSQAEAETASSEDAGRNGGERTNS